MQRLKQSKALKILSFLAFMAVAPGSANAAYITYTSEAAWLAALALLGATTETEDFESLSNGAFPDGGGLTLDLSSTDSVIVTQSAAGAASTPKIETVANGTTGIRVQASRPTADNTTVDLTFPEMVFAFGAFYDSVDITAADNAGGVEILVGGVELGPLPDTDGASGGTMEFFGIISTDVLTDFNMITWINALVATTNITRDETFQVDDISWAARPAPEPAALFLIGMGLAGLGLARRRRGV